MNFMIFSVPVFALIFDVFYITFGSLFASICMLPRTLFLTFSFLFRKGFPLGSLSPFWLHFGRLLAPIWLPFGVPLLPFASLLVAFGTPALRLAPLALHLGYLSLPLLPFLSLSSLNLPFFRDSPHFPLTFRIYYLMRGKPRSRPYGKGCCSCYLDS